MDSIGLKVKNESRVADAFVWRAPGKPVSIEITFDVVDRLEAEIMRAFGAIPRLGLEAGGILLGSAGQGEKLSVRIEDFEPVMSEHEGGPSYVLSGKDRERFEEALKRWRPRPGRQMRAIGFYRGHAREGLCLGQQDLEMFSAYFPEETGIALVVKPFATRPPMAGLFFREGAVIRSESSYQEFPFRRREMGEGNGEEQNPVQRLSSAAGDAISETAMVNTMTDGLLGIASPGPSDGGQIDANGGPDKKLPPVPARSLRLRGGWVWIPLSFIFLLLGTVLGFQVALSVRSQITNTPRQDPYVLSLTASPSAGSVHLRWDRQSPAIRKAQRGVLVISESGSENNIDLDIGHLRNGSVIYRRASDEVRFRLEVFTAEKASVSETVLFQSKPVPDDSSRGG